MIRADTGKAMMTPQRPRRGAPKKDEPSATERLIETATDLFYREGIRATGVDTVVERTGISKTSLYRCFATKDDLIVAVLTDLDARFWRWWDGVVAAAPAEPAKTLDALLTAFAKLISSPNFRGCPFLNTAIEFRDLDHPARKIAEANKREVARRLRDLCERLSLTDPEAASAELALLINGALASGLVGQTRRLEARLHDAAHRIVAAQSLQKPARRIKSR